MIAKRPLLFDVDDVLSLMTERITAELSEALGRPWTIDEVPDGEWDLFTSLAPELSQFVRSLLAAPGFVTSLQPDPDAQLALAYFREQGHEVFAVTAPNGDSETWVYERERWLHEHFDLDYLHVVNTHAKYICEGAMLVDDRHDYVEKWAWHHPDGIPVLWHTEANKRVHGPADKWRVHGWDTLVDIVAKL